LKEEKQIKRRMINQANMMSKKKKVERQLAMKRANEYQLGACDEYGDFFT
jgi:hypothetical protein